MGRALSGYDASGSGYRSLSLWHDDAGEDLTPRPALPAPTSCDVAIVGAGFTGLWTAYYLLRSDPTLRVVVLEQEIAGYGASGRNGGWCSALLPTSWDVLVRESSPDEALRMHRAMQATVREVGRVVEAEAIDADYHRGGTVTLARTPVQLERVRAGVATAHARGFTDEDERLLTAEEAQAVLGAENVLGGSFTPHCAAIHPTRLVRGLARVVEAAGATVHERTPVRCIAPGTCRDRRRHGPRGGRDPRDRGLHPPAGRVTPGRSCRCTR